MLCDQKQSASTMACKSMMRFHNRQIAVSQKIKVIKMGVWNLARYGLTQKTKKYYLPEVESKEKF